MEREKVRKTDFLMGVLMGELKASTRGVLVLKLKVPETGLHCYHQSNKFCICHLKQNPKYARSSLQFLLLLCNALSLMSSIHLTPPAYLKHHHEIQNVLPYLIVMPKDHQFESRTNSHPLKLQYLALLGGHILSSTRTYKHHRHQNPSQLMKPLLLLLIQRQAPLTHHVN